MSSIGDWMGTWWAREWSQERSDICGTNVGSPAIKLIIPCIKTVVFMHGIIES